ncbi:MAG: ATP-dependent DNA helicase [Anaerolineales bacterium]|nr:ATP-dependent DNA helicase [Anaerolineales bacterium]
MNVHADIIATFPDLNPQQREVVGHVQGPLLVIAGPGSGKTYSLVLRALNLLLLGKANPDEIILCTFTEKAAYEMRDRLADAARKVGYQGGLSQLLTGTIHSISNRFVTRYRHHTDLGHGYETLDELTQWLFLYDNFDAIFFAPDANGKYLHKWSTRWTAIQGASRYFNKITEELVDPDSLVRSGHPFLSDLGKAYRAYHECLLADNCIDFAHQQRLFLDLLHNPEIGPKILEGLKFTLVDEYQDTNYIQERLVLKLTEQSRNLCVVGDEDQSLYRFRGATVRNILEFPKRVPGCKIVKLATNYRSHEQIIRAYDQWMSSADWSNSGGQVFRYDKTIQPDPEGDFPEYPAVFAIWGSEKRDEARRFADLVGFLKKNHIIEDYSQVALLLHSVRPEHSGPFLEALEAKGIPAFCPRARAYFDEEEVRLIVGAFAVILGHYDKGRGNLRGYGLQALARYVDDCISNLAQRYADPHPLAKGIQSLAAEVEGLERGESLDRRLADYLYELLAVEPFSQFVQEENHARRLAIFSTLLNVFQSYYHYTVITFNNRVPLRMHFFNSFLRLLYEGGINDYEDPNQPIPSGYVQVMTIHQAKGLEFAAVAVSVEKTLPVSKQVDRDLSPYYHRPPFEPESRITAFDRMRLHYVAFSRPQKVLVLSSSEPPKDYFGPIWQGLPQWPYVEQDLLAAQRFDYRPRMAIKKSYSFTGDLRIYDTCPRQYQFFRHYEFTPSRSTVIFFGLLVHQAIEDIHRIVLDGGLDDLDEHRVEEIFDRTFNVLLLSDVRPPGPEARQAALHQVLNYFRQNQEVMRRIVDAEVDVSLEKDGYILTGKVDLMLGGDGKLELLDFKTQECPDDPELFDAYEQQLCTYGHILETRYGKRPERLLVYWTAEQEKRNAVTVFPYREGKVQQAVRNFDQTVARIQALEFRVLTPPGRKICKNCDIRSFCVRESLIEPFV